MMLPRAAIGTKLSVLVVAAVVVVGTVALVSLSQRPSTSPPISTSRTYAVSFQQIGACSPTFWGVPWSVTIGNVTKVQPPDTTLPLDNYSLSGTTNSSLSEITFSLADGTYDYRVSPSAEFFTPTFGTVKVSGSNTTVDIAYTGTSCITTSQVTSSTSTTQVASVTNGNGLEFTMSLNSSNLVRGSNLTVSLNLNNTLDRINNVTGAEDWRLTNQSESGPSMNCAQNDPFRTEVLKGYYDSGNYSVGAPLVFTVFQPPLGFNECLLFIRAANDTAQPLFVGSENYYIFSPLSNRAQWIASNANQPATMGEVVLLEPSLFSNSTGVFTVVSGDEWGDLQIAHFVVEP